MLYVWTRRGFFAPTAAATAPAELMSEEAPLALSRVTRLKRNQLKSSTEKAEGLQKENVDRMQSASSNSSSESNPSRGASASSTTSSTAILKANDDYYLHTFRHTRSSVYKEV